MDISLFDYQLPPELIAQSSANPRDHSKLLVIDRKTGKLEHRLFYDIANFLTDNDVLVLNNTKVFPARFFGKKNTGGNIEVLLIEETRLGTWKALTKPGIKSGQTIFFEGLNFKAVDHIEQTVLLETHADKIDILSILEKFGHTPLPPYIHSNNSEKSLRKKYQTVYAKTEGSVAAPTAGFHFTQNLLNKLIKKGIQIEYVTLHVGLGTFVPVKSKSVEDHPMHYEYFEVKKDVAIRLNQAKKTGKRIISVGTTTTRVLETLVNKNLQLKINNLKGSTSLFVYPPYKYIFVDSLITNFHLPKSTLLCLVSAFVSSPNTNESFTDFKSSLMGKAYTEAINKNYRFYSFGDASLIF